MFTATQWLLAPLAFFAAWVITACAGHLAVRRNFLDMPNKRSSHLTATPRGGGLSIVIVFTLIVGSALYLQLDMMLPSQAAGAFIIGGLAIAAVGWLDDRRHLHFGIRLVIHFVAVLFCLALLGLPPLSVMEACPALGWTGYAATAVALVWCLNAFNFMDGIDGIAAMQTMTMSLSAVFILMINAPASVFIPYLLILAAATAGFLIWNWPPAKIFMGDVASGFLGFILGMFAVMSSLEGGIAIWSWVILFGVFAADTSVVLALRFWRGEKLHQAHRQHAYQRLAMSLQRIEEVLRSPEYARTVAHQTVTLAVMGINLFWLLPWALIATLDAQYGFIYAVAALFPVVAVVVKSQRIGGIDGLSW